MSCGSCLKWVWERGVRGTSVGTGVAGSCERNARRIAATEEADCRDRQEISFTLNQESYETGYTFLSAPVPLLQIRSALAEAEKIPIILKDSTRGHSQGLLK